MSNILFIEPNYKNKYPPIGLMKLATFHKMIRHDYVRFSKGELPDAMVNGKWDRVYVTSLFTFEWNETIKAIKYALTLVDSSEKVVVGGIAATLMPEQIYQETGVHPICGLLNEPDKLGIPGDECIDHLIPDYAILDDTADQYIYPFHDAYFLSATKGCGQRCGFCAVQTLEPKYVPYMDIKEKIKAIDRAFGKKRDLLLMDNNVLRSNQFNQIIDDILEAGFEKGANHVNPKTGKKVRRYVDFNQGLDANFLTPDKARRLGEIALRPARIAFDHIEDRDTYERAIRLCAENGVTELSNYILYNSEDFNGKGKSYHADTPEHLYNRMRITLDLKETINQALPEDRKIDLFSFPMRYIPLSARERGYVGSKWNPKFLRAVQCMLIPTQGKGVGSRSFFEADFGKDATAFERFICMPEKLIAARGKFFVGGKGRTSETDEQINDRRNRWELNQLRLAEWDRLYDQLCEERNEFIDKISDNEYLPEKLFGLRTGPQKILYLHYLTEPRILALLGKLESGSPTRMLIKHYLVKEFPTMYDGLVSLLVSAEIQQSFMFKNFLDCFGHAGLRSIMQALEPKDYDADKQMTIWSKICKKSGITYIDFELIRIYRRYVELAILPEAIHSLARMAIKNENMQELGVILHEYFPDFRNRLSNNLENEHGKQTLFQMADLIFGSIQMKLSNMVVEVV